MSAPSTAWAVRCTKCKIDLSLLGPVFPSPASHDKTAARPSAAAVLRRKALLPICTALFGVLVLPALYFLDRNDTTHRAVIIAAAASILAFGLYWSKRRFLACALAIPFGLVLFVKPFVRPVMHDGQAFSLVSETHYYFLIPGLCMIVVFGLMLLDAFDWRESEFKDSTTLRIIAGVVFVAGIVVGHFTFGGPTVSDVITQYQPQGEAMRKQFFKLAVKLPAVGELKPLEAKLEPPPVWIEGQSQKGNIEIVTVEELWNPEETPKARNLYLSDDLLNCVRWTSRKNPMSSSVMGDQAGDFPQRMTRAFGVPWIAAYRPGTIGLEIFVFDLRNGNIAAAIAVKGMLGEHSQDRKLVLDALAKATGGTFQVK